MKNIAIAFLVIISLVIGIFLGSRDVREKIAKLSPYEIHFVNYRGRTDIDKGFESFLYASGINYQVTYHDAERDPIRLEGISKELESSNADLIVTFGTTTTLAIFGSYKKPKLQHISGIFTLVTAPVLSDIVPNTSSSLRNITGTIHVAPLENQLRLMMAYRKTNRVGVIYTPTEINSIVIIDEMKQVAAKLGFEVIAIPFDVVDGKPSTRNAKEALAIMEQLGVGWLYLPPDSHLGTQAKDLIIPASNAIGIPTFASTEQLMQAGATFGLLSSYYELGIIAGEKAARILVDGVKPESLPIDRPPRFLKKVNREVATRLGFGELVNIVELIEPAEIPNRETR